MFTWSVAAEIIAISPRESIKYSDSDADTILRRQNAIPPPLSVHK